MVTPRGAHTRKDKIMAEAYSWLPAEPITDVAELLETVLGIVTEHPEAYDQVSWVAAEDPDGTPVDLGFDSMTTYETREPKFGLKELREGTVDCGTTCCVAGWIVTLAGGRWVSEGHVRMPDGTLDMADLAATHLISKKFGIKRESPEYTRLGAYLRRLFDGDNPPKTVVSMLEEMLLCAQTP